MPGYPPVEELLPHAAPMVLLDAVEEADGLRCRCRVEVRSGAPFVGDGGVPAFVGVEYLAQAVGALSGWRARLSGKAPQLGFLLSVREYASDVAMFPMGTTLLVEVTHVWGEGEMMRFDGILRDATHGQILAQGGLSVFSPENPDSYLKGAA